MYSALGQTDFGRYLIVYFIYKFNHDALVISARDMDEKEKRKHAKKKKRDPLPQNFKTLEEAAEFWDTHSLADYWRYSKPVKFDIQIKEPQRYITLDEKVASKLHRFSRKSRTPVDVLVNLWVQERLQKVA